MSVRPTPSTINQTSIPLLPQPPQNSPGPSPQSLPQGPLPPNSSQNVQPSMFPGPVANGNTSQAPGMLAMGIPARRKVSRRDADLEPWRYLGYPALSAYVASDDDLFVLRRFERLGARVALMMQDRIAKLEEDLLQEDELGRYEKSHCGTFRYEPRKRRSDLMEEIKWRLTEYQKFILDHSKLKARPDANEFQTRNVKTWMENNNNPIKEEEARFLDSENDLMPMVPKTKTPLRRFIDRYQLLRRIICFRERELNRTHYGHNDEENFVSDTTVYIKDSTVDKFVTCTTIALGLVMLIVPLWLLQHYSTTESNIVLRLTIITVFLVSFTLLLTLITVAKPFETLAATAAYGAVLMVFMQVNFGSGS